MWWRLVRRLGPDRMPGQLADSFVRRVPIVPECIRQLPARLREPDTVAGTRRFPSSCLRSDRPPSVPSAIPDGQWRPIFPLPGTGPGIVPATFQIRTFPPRASLHWWNKSRRFPDRIHHVDWTRERDGGRFANAARSDQEHAARPPTAVRIDARCATVFSFPDIGGIGSVVSLVVASFKTDFFRLAFLFKQSGPPFSENGRGHRSSMKPDATSPFAGRQPGGTARFHQFPPTTNCRAIAART